MRIQAILALLGLGLGTPLATGQAFLWEVAGQDGEQFGEALAAVGDLDGDGVADLAIGVPDVDRVRLRSGATGAFLGALGGPEGSLFGQAIAPLGDVDGDGVDDFAVAAPEADAAFGAGPEGGLVQILSGATGAVLAARRGQVPNDQYGAAVVGLGDVDGDGIPDLAVGDLDGTVQVSSCADFAPIATLDSPSFGFGRLMAGGADLDLDGVPDLLVAAPGAWPAATLTAFSGARLGQPQDILFHLTFLDVNDPLGMSLALAGDVDADGHEDIAVGFPNATRPAEAEGFEHLGFVRVLDRTGASLREWVSPAPTGEEFYGIDLAPLGDANGDGHDDLAVITLGRAADVRSGLDGTPLFSGLLSNTRKVAGPGDVDGDGLADLALSAPGIPVLGVGLEGRAMVVSARQGTITSVGESCSAAAINTALLGITGTASAGGRLRILGGWGVDTPLGPNVAGSLLIGLPSTPTPLPNGCSVLVAPVLIIQPFPVSNISLIETNSWGALDVDVPASLAGLTVRLQLAFAEPAHPLTLSAAVDVAVAP